jgi:hypothetical protein
MTDHPQINPPRLNSTPTMPTPPSDHHTEEEIQFTTAAPSPAPPGPGFWSRLLGRSEEKMQGVEDEDGDQFFDEANEEEEVNVNEATDKEPMDDSKRGKDTSSPLKTPKKARDASTGGPSPNSLETNENEILDDAIVYISRCSRSSS